MNYIPADKLKAEIKELESVYSSKKRVIHGIADGFRQDGMAVMCDIILKIITSLQQEQPEVDFEKEYKSYVQSRKDDLSGNAVTVNMKDLARHFYELGRLNARKEE